MHTIKALLLILRSPIRIWSWGGWSAACWVASGKSFWHGLWRGVPWVVDDACRYAIEHAAD